MDYYQDFSAGGGSGGGSGEGNQSGQSQRGTAGTAGIPGKDDEKKLFVGGLSRETTDRELKEYFGKFGEIESVTVKIDQYTGQSRGFAFIVFNNPKTIDKLLAAGDHYIQKRKVDPKRVSKKAQHGKIYVGGLTPEISDDDIKGYFSQYGNIVEFQAPFDKMKNQRKGFCFITFESKDPMFNLLKTPKQFINGKEVDVKKVRANAEGGRGGGQRNGYGQGYGQGYGGYDGYGYSNYGNSYDYGNYAYDGYSYDSQGGYGGNGNGKPRNRQFSRHQPY
ncbi:RNA-binding protein squid-like [Thrips palmi]|uniref:RNA-binding protein squid-like n=1 Tax=Thrips palmi TaxID=161013 RepID=A0A6P8YSX7_THRPL|nr:RNA-binding protein squid-like [Thrips palmi]